MRRLILIVQLILVISVAQGADLLLATDSLSLDIDIEQSDTSEDKAKKSNRFKQRRVERNIKNHNYIFAGEKFFGVSASYNSLSGENSDFLLILDDIDASGSIGSVKPYVGYFYRDNRAVGVRFGYSAVRGTVNSTTLDLGDVNDLSFDIPYISLRSDSFNYGVFHRAYAPIDKTGHVGLFAEVELYASSGRSIFEFENGDSIVSTESLNRTIGVSFSPGISAFVMSNVSASLSFELGGISFTRIDQYDETGELVGSRNSSQMRFMINLLAINFGINVHLW